MKTELSRSASWMTGATAVQSGIGFVANILLVRLLSPAAFGEFAIAVAIVSLVAIAVDLNLPDILVREPMDRLEEGGLDILLTGQLLETLVVAAAAPLVLFLSGALTPEAVLLVVGQVGGIWSGSYKRLFERRFEYQRISVLEAGANVTKHVVAVGGAALGLGPVVLYIRNIIQSGLVLGGLSYLGGLVSFRPRWLGREELGYLISTVREFWFEHILKTSFNHIVILTVGALAGTVVTGYFYQARKLAMYPHKILEPASFRVMLNFFSNDETYDGRLPARILGLEALTMSGVVAGVVLLGDPLIPLVLGSNWAPVTPLLVLLSGMILGLTVLSTLQAYAMAEGLLRPFILLGRFGQYAVFGASLGLLWLGSVAAVDAIAVALSLSVLIPVVLLLAYFHRTGHLEVVGRPHSS